MTVFNIHLANGLQPEECTADQYEINDGVLSFMSQRHGPIVTYAAGAWYKVVAVVYP